MDLDQACIVREGQKEYCIYPLDTLMSVLGKKWTLFIIAVLGNRNRMRFSEMQGDLKFLSSRTLTDRLKELEELGLIERRAYAEIPPRVEYELTKEGMGLRRVLIPLLSWAIDYETSGRNVPETVRSPAG